MALFLAIRLLQRHPMVSERFPGSSPGVGFGRAT